MRNDYFLVEFGRKAVNPRAGTYGPDFSSPPPHSMKRLFFLAVLLFGSFLDAAETLEFWKYLRTDDAVSVKQEWKPTRNDANITGGPIRIAGRKFNKGLGTHAPGEIVFNLDGKHKNFRTFVGVDDGGGPSGSVVFQIFLDGERKFDSGMMQQGEAAKEIKLDVNGVKELKLVCTDAGNGVQGDWANWADAAVDDFETITPKSVPKFSTAGFYAVEGSPRKVWSFNPGWRFFKGNVDGAEKPEFDDSQWEAANLPHGLEILGSNESGGRNYRGPAWYRKVFEIPAESKGKNFVLYFEAVMGKSKVFLDGKQVAEHFGGYLPFAVDLTEQLRDGGKHLVAVLADNSDDPSYPPGKPQGQLDFTYLGGIYRDVSLIETNPTHFTLPELSPTVAGGGVFVGVMDARDDTAAIRIALDFDMDRKCKCRLTIENAEGQEIFQEIISESQAGMTHAFELRFIKLANVRLWHPDDPYQHWIKTELLDENGNVLDSLRTRVGFRLFEMKGNDGFYVNGKPFEKKLSGVNRHQDYAVVGNAVPNSGQWRDAKLLREGGCNVVRAAHYPLDPAFMDACDALGLLVTVANPGWQFYNDKNREFWKRCVADTRSMARRDRNRPAVLLWETALNETDHQPVSMLAEMHKALHEEIPFPGVFSVGDSDHARPAGFDVYYYARGDEPICSFTREYGDGGEVENFMSQNASSRVKREWGEHALLKQAMIRCRDLPGNFHPSRKQIGSTLWCGIDHQRGYHPDPFWGGLLDEFRNPKYSYYVFKSQYDPDFKLDGIVTGPMVFIAHELTQISPPDVTVLTNCEEVRLTWLGKEIGTKKPEDGYKNMPHPPVVFRNAFDFRVITSQWRNRTDEIEMIAEGLIDGKTVVVQKKKYAQRTTRIKLELDDCGVGVTADGGDFVPVRATAVDQHGTPKVLASEYVSFIVDGNGELIGGPPQLNPMKTEFGVATALVRPTTKSGPIRIRAFSDGLIPSDALIIPTNKSPLPLLYDAEFAAASKKPAQGIIVHVGATKTGNTDVENLQREVDRLKLEAVGREQELMELRSAKGAR